MRDASHCMLPMRFMAVLCAVFVLIVLAAGEVQAQSGSGGPSFAPPQNVATGEEVFPGEMVVDVQIAGHRDLSKEQIRSYIKTRPGRPFNPDTIREDIRRLSRTRMFVNVSTEYQRTGDNVTVVFRVVERPTINYIHYLGNKRQSDTRLARETKLKVGEPLDPYTVEEARTKLIEYYKSKGMGEVHVSVMEGLKPDDRGVVFLFNEGAVQRIWDVKFEGNTIVPDGRLKTKISSKEPFLMLFGGYVNQDQIDADVSQLVQYYRDLGYRAARVGRELEFDEDRGWLTLTFHIQEGPRSTVDRVVVEGVTKFRQEDISGALKLTRGQYFERGQFNEDIARIQEIYGTAGYIFADVKPEIIEHASDNGVDIVYRIDEKQRYRVGRIEVQVRGANLHTHVRTVMNRLSIQPGDIVNIQQIRASERRLAASGLFETAPDRAPQLILQPVNEEFDGQSVADSGGVTRGQSPDPPREVPVQLQPARAHSGLSPRTDQARHRIPPPPPAGYRGQSPDEARDIMYVDAPWTQENNIQLKWKQPSNQHNQAGSRPNTSVRVAAYQQNIGGSPRPGNRAPRLGFNDSQPRVRMQSPGGFNPNPNPPRYSGPGFGGSSFAGSAVAGDNPPPSANYYGQAGQFGGSQSGQAPFNSAPTNQPSYTPPANNYGYQSNSPPPTTNPFTSGAQNPPQSSATTGQGLGTSFGAPPIPRPDELPGVPPQPGGGLVFPDGGVTPPQLDPLADIVIPVEVTQTGRFNFGVGINSDAGVVGNIVLDETNFDISRYPRSMGEVLDGRAFRGAGQHFRFEAVPGSQLQRYMVSFTEPYVFDSLFSFSTSGFFFDRRYDDWDEQRVGGTVGFGYQFQSRPDLSINFSLRGENVNVRNARLPVAPSVAAMVGDNEIWGAGVQLTHDTRDNSFLPTEGHLWQVGFEQIFGKYDFPRVNSDFRQYFLLHQRPDRSGRHVVALRGRMGITGNQTPAFEQYFAGGFSTLRGFDFRGASPVEVTSRVGGEFLLLSSVEYLFPITADDALRGVVFVDAGTVEESVKIVGSDFRVAPGAGLRIQVPGMGPAPIALDFAWAVNKEATDQTQVFSFFVGFFR